MLQTQKLTSEKRKKSSLVKKKSFIGSVTVADPIKLFFCFPTFAVKVECLLHIKNH